MTIKIILRNGVTIPVKCDNFTLRTNGFGAATGYTIEGIAENKPIYVNFGDISAITRVISDEEGTA